MKEKWWSPRYASVEYCTVYLSWLIFLDFVVCAAVRDRLVECASCAHTLLLLTCSAAGGSHYTARWSRSTYAKSESVWSATAATNATAVDVVWTPDADPFTTHAVRGTAGRTWRRRDAVGGWHSTTDSSLSCNDTAYCDYSSRPCTTVSTGCTPRGTSVIHYSIHCVPKNVTTLSCCNFDVHKPFFIFFW